VNEIRVVGDIPELPVTHKKLIGSSLDRWGHTIIVNKNGFRTIEFEDIDYSKPRMLTFGCSHTWGDSNEQSDIWPEKLAKKLNLQLINLGQPGASVDYVYRIFSFAIKKFAPVAIFIYWPDWTRFEYIKDGRIFESLPNDSNRIYHMKTATEEWLINNFISKVNLIKEESKDIKLVHLSSYNLIPYMDHADRWPIAKDNIHFNFEWHQNLYSIFYELYINNQQPIIVHE
jgi:hypothetical protein